MKRGSRNPARDKKILAEKAKGISTAKIATKHNVSASRIHQIVRKSEGTLKVKGDHLSAARMKNGSYKAKPDTLFTGFTHREMKGLQKLCGFLGA